MIVDYVGEVASALLTSWCVSPMVALVDRAIFTQAAGDTMNYYDAFQDIIKAFLLRPSEFFTNKAFWWSHSVYMCTFVTSNVSERAALSAALEHPLRAQLLAVCAVNMPLSALRDRHLVARYGRGGARKADCITTAAFVLRDLITMTGAFAAIGPVSERFEAAGLNPLPARTVSQLVCPVVAMLVNTPVFMIGLHHHNYPEAGARQMARYIYTHYWDTLYWARVARVGLAYSVGGVLNMVFRLVLTSPLPPPPPPPPPPEPPRAAPPSPASPEPAEENTMILHHL